MAKKKKKKKHTNVNANSVIGYNNCHSGNVLVADSPVKLYGGGYTRGLKAMRGAIIIDCADVIAYATVNFHGMSIPRTLKRAASPSYNLIKIEWEDGGAPWSLDADFWASLAEFLVIKNRPVLACCLGGHGRTGTTVAILAHFWGITYGDDAGLWVRRHYCENAIETIAQTEYIQHITGVKTYARPSWIMPATQTGKSRTYGRDVDVFGHSYGQEQYLIELDDDKPDEQYDGDDYGSEIDPDRDLPNIPF